MNTLQKQTTETPTRYDEPWQLKLFRRSLKKQRKLAALLGLLGNVEGQECMLITCGDNNGALNWHFKQHGGNWTWADAEEESTEQISSLTGDPVLAIDKVDPKLPAADNHYDLVVTIDVHEHLSATEQLNRELARVIKQNGRVVVTTPGGDQRKLANRIKHWLGMSASEYGHVVDGYDIPELEAQLKDAGLTPVENSSYSRFFTEMVELMINYTYVKVLSKRSQAKVEQGQIAPQNPEQLKSVEKTYKMYSLIYPFVWVISKLDYLVRFTRGYAVIVVARKR